MGELEQGEELWGELESPDWSGAGERQGVLGPGERLWVGEPDKLSLEDTECWKPVEKLRLLCMGEGVCLVIFFKTLRRLLSWPSFLLLFLLRRAILPL